MLPDPTEVDYLRLIMDILNGPISVKFTTEQEKALMNILVNTILSKYAE